MIRVRTEDVAWREVEGEVLLLNLHTSRYFTVNASAAVLWRTLDGGATRDELVNALIDEFDLPREQAATDVDAFVAHARQNGLVVDDEAE